MISLSLVTIVSTFALVAILLYFRYQRRKLLHAERMAAIEKNLPLPDTFFAEPAQNMREYLLRGLVWIAVGVGLAIFFFAFWLSERTDPEMLGATTLGLIPILVGVAHLIYYRMAGKRA